MHILTNVAHNKGHISLNNNQSQYNNILAIINHNTLSQLQNNESICITQLDFIELLPTFESSIELKEYINNVLQLNYNNIVKIAF